MAEGGAPRSSVRTWRTPAPRRRLPAVGLDLEQLLDGRRDVLGLVDLGQRPGGRRDEVEADLVLLLELGEDRAPSSCASQPCATASRVGSACPAFWASSDAAARTCGFGVLVDDLPAGRVVDHDDEVRQARPLDREHRLGEHEDRQQHQGDPERGQAHLVGRRRLPLAAVEPEDQPGAAEHDEQRAAPATTAARSGAGGRSPRPPGRARPPGDRPVCGGPNRSRAAFLTPGGRDVRTSRPGPIRRSAGRGRRTAAGGAARRDG